ncbi:hypothetical protein J2Z76_002926 [Sedimentibacter acidaminivorans]|uniref:Uncharacterized protein n=1 Tax=Sedimentibacter acidaminivorans TaxID=913099 RepID=A0ABS4GHC6_9FIRM|nr:hypothetical protein [Sedimentibacter acidaminivorans]MBP1927054.1 hypothetical protein [Sedimentibacter acidaminivorans]
MNKIIVVKNEFVSKTSEEKELNIADIIAKMINNGSYNKQSVLMK